MIFNFQYQDGALEEYWSEFFQAGLNIFINNHTGRMDFPG